MVEFFPVQCPNCQRRIIGEIATGLSRFKCPDCGSRVSAGCDGHEVRIVQVDRPLRRRQNRGNRIALAS